MPAIWGTCSTTPIRRRMAATIFRKSVATSSRWWSRMGRFISAPAAQWLSSGYCRKRQNRVAGIYEARTRLVSAQAAEQHFHEDLLDFFGAGDLLGVVPAIQPIAHAQNAVDDQPRLAFDQLALFLAALHQIHKPIVVARDHRNHLVLAFSGEGIKFVQEQSERHFVLNDVVDLRPDGAFELFDGVALRIDLPRDVGVAILDARQQELEKQIFFRLDVVVERALEHAD